MKPTCPECDEKLTREKDHTFCNHCGLGKDDGITLVIAVTVQEYNRWLQRTKRDRKDHHLVTRVRDIRSINVSDVVVVGECLDIKHNKIRYNAAMRRLKECSN